MISLHSISLVILFGVSTCLTLALILWMAPWGNLCQGLQSDAALWGHNLTDKEYLPRTVRDVFDTLIQFSGTRAPTVSRWITAINPQPEVR